MAVETTYALFVRGINVGTKNSLPMAELRALLEEAGAREVRTYVQSGNAVFRTKLAEATLVKKSEALLSVRMGRPIAVTVRTATELAAVAAKNPWPKIATNGATLAVTFLGGPPPKAALAPLAQTDFSPELFTVRGREIYSWHPAGQGRSALAAAIAKLSLTGAVTTRNWNTVQKLATMCAE